ncbi:MAG TPA: endonuclease Q family protein [Xanthomonadales bacterium]|nr:endonuclease Q family protein [Xanthomonadales bacterium]
MQYLSDLHLHSKYSRAVSPRMTLPLMAEFAHQKGLDILTASDWTHTLWFKEIIGLLEEAGQGIYALKSEARNLPAGKAGPKSETNSNDKNPNAQKKILFLLSTEISSIYKQGEKLRRIHNLVFVPGFDIAEKVNKELLKRGCNLSSDGRPIVGLTSKALLELILSIDERSMLIPCHVWTPHFGVYGSKSGFDSLDEAFGALSKYVYGIETGISSDPEMNWRIKELSNRSILSFSDAHSPANMAREATAFELEAPTYENIRKAIMRPSKSTTGTTGITSTTGKKAPDTRGTLDTRDTLNRIAYTIEFYPEEGKYHFSGHRNCKVSFSPVELVEKGKICPVCQRELTEGVAPRIEILAGAEAAKEYKEKTSESGIKWYTDKTRNHPPYVKLVRLEQIIAAGLGVTTGSQKVPEMYAKMCKELGSEMDILLKINLDQIENSSNERTAQTLKKVRGGGIGISPGYDGEYGKVKIWSEEEEERETKGAEAPQLKLDI